MSALSKSFEFLDYVENQAIAQALQQPLPIVAGQLGTAPSTLAFTSLRDALTTALQSAGATDAASLAAALGPAFEASVDGGAVVFRLLGQANASTNLTGAALGFQTGGGTPAILAGSGSVDAALTADLDIRLRYDPATDVLTVEPGTDELAIGGEVGVDFAQNATLGALQVALSDEESGTELEFAITADITGTNAVTTHTPQIASAGLQLGMQTAVTAGVLPDLSTDVTATWLPAQSATPEVQFQNVAMDAGDLLDLVEPLLDPIRDVIFGGPVGSVVGAVTAPIPVLDAGLGAIGLRDAFDLIPEGGGDGRINFLDILGYYWLCCTNRLRVELPLSPGRLILRAQ